MTDDGQKNKTSNYPWLSHYPDYVDWSAPIKSGNLATLLDEAAERFADRPAVDFLDKIFTYGEISDLADRFACGLQALGVKKGTRVGLFLPNTPFSVICYFGILRAGGIVVNFSPLYVERELMAQIKDSNTEIMVTIDLALLFDKIKSLPHTQGPLRQIIVCSMLDVLTRFKGLMLQIFKRKQRAHIPEDSAIVTFAQVTDNDGRLTPVKIDPEADIAVLQYTGGTTGVSKGAMLTHANLTANVSQNLLWLPDVEPGREVIVGILPMFHVFAMTVVMNFAVACGALMLLLPRFELKQTLKTIHNKRPTLLPAVPTIYTAINISPERGKYDLSSIRYCMSGGAPLPLQVKRTFEESTGCRLVEGYGLSETSPVAVANPFMGVNKPGSIGLPLPGTRVELRDLEDPTRQVPQGERGEVCIAGPQVMLGYRNRPEESVKSFVGEFFRTGDVGYMDEDGYIFLVDRIKDLILSSGFNIYPRAIEEAIQEHPAVAEVTVIGIPDSFRGEAPKAFIRLKDKHHLTAPELLTFLQDKLGKLEMPVAIEFRAQLPKTMIGKLSKKELRAETTQG